MMLRPQLPLVRAARAALVARPTVPTVPAAPAAPAAPADLRFGHLSKACLQEGRDVVYRLQESEFERSRRLQVRLQTTKIRILRT